MRSKSWPAQRIDGGGRGWLWAAGVCALIHAAPSMYWATGGRAFVWTIGDWAADLATAQPLLVSVALVIVAAVKVLGGAIPILNSYGFLPGQRIWQKLILAGGAFLTLYGGANTLFGGLALLGWFGPLTASGERALMGHVFLWDPIFLAWGVCLVVGTGLQMRALGSKRRSRRPTKMSALATGSPSR